MALAFLPSSVQFLAGLQHQVKCRPSRLHRQGEAQVCCSLPTVEYDTLHTDAWNQPGAQQALQQKVQWYPGHIAKAERQLKAQLGLVDVVLEMRDARIPLATCHRQIPRWCGAKPRILILNRVDLVSDADEASWSAEFSRLRQPIYWTNSNAGTGVPQVAKAASQASKAINARRSARGLKPRAVRACVIGFPNVGKSALINRLVGRRACDSAPKPGVTRSLKWVRVGGDLDLLDAPGIIPVSFDDQRAAQLLAICNDIGEASYVDSQIAATLVETMRELPSRHDSLARLAERFSIALDPGMTGEDYIVRLAEDQHQSDIERAGLRILRDFRNGALGSVALEVPSSRKLE